MKKNFKNFLLLTLGIAIGSTTIIMTLIELIGEYTYIVLAGLFFASLLSMAVSKFKKIN